MTSLGWSYIISTGGHGRPNLSLARLIIIMKVLIPAYVCIFIAVLGLPGRGEERASPPVSIGGDLEYRWGDSPLNADGGFRWSNEDGGEWKGYALPGSPPGRKGMNSLWVRTRLPEGDWVCASILLSRVHQKFEVYLDGKNIYQFGSFSEAGKGIFPGYKWFHIIPLPENFQKKRVHFRFYSEFQSIGFTDAVVDSASNHMREIVRGDMVKLSMGILYLMLGLLVLAYFITRKGKGFDLKRQGATIFPFFIVSAVCYGFAVIADTRIKELVLDAPVAWLYIRLAGVYLFAAMNAGFIYHVFESRFRETLKYMSILLLVFAVASLGLSASGIVPVMSTILPFNYLIIAGSGVLLLNMLTSRIKGNRDAYLLIAGMGIFSAAVIRDALVDMGILPRYEFIQHWGMLAFIVSLGLIMMSRIFDLNRRYYGYARELQIARGIQMSIIPKESPSVPGVNIATVYIPMESVGGDFFDFHQLGDGRLGIFISDISGHGVPSALISSMLKVIFDYESHGTDDPGSLLAGINRKLYAKMETNFLTASYTLIDLERRKMYNANAGHPPMILWRPGTAELQEYKPKGRLIGQFSDISCDTQEIEIRSGDKVFLYTDGIIEARNGKGEMFGDLRFHEFIRCNGGMPAAEFIDAMLKMASSWVDRDAGFGDDYTMLVMDIT